MVYRRREEVCREQGRGELNILLYWGPKLPPRNSPLSGHSSRDWSEYVNEIRVISEPFARELR